MFKIFCAENYAIIVDEALNKIKLVARIIASIPNFFKIMV